MNSSTITTFSKQNSLIPTPKFIIKARTYLTTVNFKWLFILVIQMQPEFTTDKLTMQTNFMDILTDLVWMKRGGYHHPHPSPAYFFLWSKMQLTSGAIRWIFPPLDVSPVSYGITKPKCLSAKQHPKSVMTRCGTPSELSSTSRLSFFKSRWAMPFLFKCTKPSRSWTRRINDVFVVILPWCAET